MIKAGHKIFFNTEGVQLNLINSPRPIRIVPFFFPHPLFPPKTLASPSSSRFIAAAPPRAQSSRRRCRPRRPRRTPPPPSAPSSAASPPTSRSGSYDPQFPTAISLLSFASPSTRRPRVPARGPVDLAALLSCDVDSRLIVVCAGFACAAATTVDTSELSAWGWGRYVLWFSG